MAKRKKSTFERLTKGPLNRKQRRELGRRYHSVQLYKSYLENFRINTVDRHAAGHDEESE